MSPLDSPNSAHRTDSTLSPGARAALSCGAVAGMFLLFSLAYWPLRLGAPPLGALRPFRPGPEAGLFGLGGPGVYLLAGLAAFAVTAALTPLFRRMALRIGMLDAPSEARKVHRDPVPYLGGLALYGGFLAWVLAVQVFAPGYAHPSFHTLAAVGAGVVLLGAADDAVSLPAWFKLAVELALGAALYFWGFGVRELMDPLGGVVHIGWFAVAVAALWVAGMMNAVNFVDGLDGLAAGVTALCALSLLAVGLRNDQVLSVMLMSGLLGMTAAFLLFNFHPASIFMGDAGALFLGLVIGAATLVEEQKGAAVIALAAPMTALAVPLADTALSFARRLARARRGGFFEPDRAHLHHRLLALGLGHRGAVLVLYAVTAAMGPLAWMVDGMSPARRYPLLALPVGVLTLSVLALRRAEERRKNAEGKRDDEGDNGNAGA